MRERNTLANLQDYGVTDHDDRIHGLRRLARGRCRTCRTAVTYV